MSVSTNSKTGRRIAGTGLGNGPVCLTGAGLNLGDLVKVARGGASVELSADAAVRSRVDASSEFVIESARRGEAVYGVTTGFGGMANVVIPTSDLSALQENVLHFMATGAGKPLPREDVRAAMLLRANSHLRGVSGLRFEIIERLEAFLNAGATPQVREFGSIGASGDLVPLTQITGAVCGLFPHFLVNIGDEVLDCATVLSRLDLDPIELGPKEGLAMVNGTSVMTGTAALCVFDTRTLLAAALGAHALYLQALMGTNQSFHPFIHRHKPHPGQTTAARLMLELLDGSRMSRDELDGRHDHRAGGPIQDRYSLRCLAQYMGPILDGLAHLTEQVEAEMNCANDNPLIDVENQRSYHGGNFLGQYVGVAMDQLRYYLGLLAKHLDVQIALLMAPEFSNGLPPSLVGNPERKINMGLKGLQLSGNSIMPVLTFLGAPMVDRFPTHAEQFNQNISSLGFTSANFARQAVSAAQEYMAMALITGVQAVDLRCHAMEGHYDARELLSSTTVPLYEAVREVAGKPPSRKRPYVWNDDEQFLDDHIARLAEDLRSGGRVPAVLEPVMEQLQ